MRKLIMSNLVSVDGFFEGPGRDLSFFKIDADLHRPMATIFDRTDTILLGKDTYQFFEAYWPTKTQSEDPAADFMNHSTKIVFSKTLETAPWGKWKEAILMKGDLVENVSKLKQQPGKDIVIFGSSGLVSALSQADLIDEYRFIVNPVILGKGRQMFGGLTADRPLKLKSATVLNFGTVFLDYERSK